MMACMRWILCGVTALMLVWVRPVMALQADELLLLTNKNVPVGAKLAETYSKHRKVSANRILLLEMPNTDEISFEQYHTKIAPQIREFIKANNLQSQIKCVVTFYGVPL